MSEFFDGVDPNAKADLNAPTVDPTVNAQPSQPALIGEGKRYKDILVADKALSDKDDFIKKLQEENASLRTTTTKISTMEEALKRIEAKNTQAATTEQTTTAAVATNANTQTLDSNKIEEMVEAKVSRLEQSKREETNRLLVANTLTKVYGDAQRANEILEKKAEELNVPVEYLKQQAKVAPAAVLKLLVPDGIAPATQGITPGSSNNGNNTTVQSGDYNAYKDPVLRQFGQPTLDGKGFKIKDAKAFERHIASKMGIKPPP